MLQSSIIRLVDLCVRRPWWTILLAIALAVASSAYAARNFAIHSDVNALISPDLAWAQRSQQYTNDFPQRNILVVVDAPTPEFSERAAAELAEGLSARADRFHAISQPGGGIFFERNGFLFLPIEQVTQLTDALVRADALVGTLAADPSLRGALGALSLVIAGVRRQEIKLDEIGRASWRE